MKYSEKGFQIKKKKKQNINEMLKQFQQPKTSVIRVKKGKKTEEGIEKYM